MPGGCENSLRDRKTLNKGTAEEEVSEALGGRLWLALQVTGSHQRAPGCVWLDWGFSRFPLATSLRPD